VLTVLLPYVEQGTVAARLKVNYSVTQPVGPSYDQVPENWSAAQTRISLFICPSDDPYAVYSNPDGVVWDTLYEYGAANSNTGSVGVSGWYARDVNLALTDYVAVAGGMGKVGSGNG
jgi:hypothetical protein